MARIRSIKPEVRRSRTVTSWPRDVRLTWVFLWGYLDDEGRGEDDLQLIKAELFPRDRDVNDKKLNDWLWLIVGNKEDGPLCRYTVDAVDYLHATNWGEHQRINRPTASKLPGCPKHDRTVNGHLRNPDGSRRDHLHITAHSVRDSVSGT